MKKIVVAAAALVKNDKLFIAQRPANKQPPLVWEFPGGKPENNETLPQALRRELQEELHVDTEIGDFIMKVNHSYDFAEVEINLFWATLKNPNDKIIDNEHVATAWISMNEVDNYEFAKADIELIKKLKQTGFSLKVS
ncbi:MAG: (deoxy)nucleoside triphosphate pyrophosphohydrolase [Alphaproteobacteria bacterium]|nr:(deoxy)nucleoside triphosphate pyrophosphohydrolase [Alphaproteobacteria bacterium]